MGKIYKNVLNSSLSVMNIVLIVYVIYIMNDMTN